MIYLDHAATTPVAREVADTMYDVLLNGSGNPSSQYPYGAAAKKRLEADRAVIAAALGCKPDELYFTSCGTESDNWAIRLAAHQNRRVGKHIITTAVEHSAVLEPCRQLEQEGYAVTYLAPDRQGNITAQQVADALREDTALVSVMLVNNETGCVFPVVEIARLLRERGSRALLHTDAVQAFLKLPFRADTLGADLISVSGHKLNAPKGVGALYIRSGVKTGKILTGGHQERGMRGGTTNVPGVVGMAEALRLAVAKLDENAAYISSLRDRFIARVQKEIPFVKLNGHPKNRLPSNANFSFRYVEGESLLFSLDLAGIAVSSGSACSSGSLEPSHVLLATGMSEGLAHGSLRFSFGRENTAEDVDYTVDKLKEIVVKLRNLSPLFPKDMKNEVFEKGE